MRERMLVLALWVIIHVAVAAACPDLAQAPTSKWHTVEHEGVHWLVTPCGERFFSAGVNAIEGGYPQRFFDGRTAYHWGTFYPDLESWGQIAQQRLLAWGFNTAGGWSLHPLMLALPTTPYLELGRTVRFHWFDPFDPATAEHMRALARRMVAPYTGNPYRIGYFTDNEVGWWNGALFIYYLKQPATNYTKQRLMTLLREYYGDDWEGFRRDFVPPFSSCSTMRAPGPSYGLAARASSWCGAGRESSPHTIIVWCMMPCARSIPMLSSSATACPSITILSPYGRWPPMWMSSRPTTTSIVPMAGLPATFSRVCDDWRPIRLC
jgi:hypothetical protein